MNDESAQNGAHRAIVAHAVIDGGSLPVFERWFEATVSALVGSQLAGATGVWRIAIALTADAVPGDELLAACVQRAAVVGGQFAVGPLTDDAGDREEELVLLLDPRAIVLASTVTRLVGAFARTGQAVAARELPVVRDGECLCVLTSVAAFAVADPRTGTVAVCTSAIVVAIPVRNREPDPSATHGSLLEQGLAAEGVSAARELLVGALGPAEPSSVSVIMRTQDARAEALRDALLTLAGQSDGRFALLLVVHNAARAEIEAIVADQPPWLTSRTRILDATGGTRSHPLNVGIAHAEGSLVAFLDDDDVVFGAWVATFLEGAARFPRRLLRARVGVQRVRTVTWPDSVLGHDPEPAVATPYPATFDLADHLRINMTPFMAFAFPRGFLTVFGGADETLEVCEDWDLVLRAASTLGVADLPTLTAIYRRWTSGGDSYTRHNSAAWERDMMRVRDRLDAVPLLLPPGSASELAALSALRNVRDELAAVRASTSWRMTAPVRSFSAWWANLRGNARGRSSP